MPTLNLSPNGLVYSRHRRHVMPSFQGNKYLIKKGYATAIGIGDVVQTDSANPGYVKLAVDGAVQPLLGVFMGVLPYYDLSAQQTMNGLNGSWPTTANPQADVECLVIDDPDALFRVQVNGGPWLEAWRGENTTWTAGTNGAPNASGISTLSLSAAGIGLANANFRIQQIAEVSLFGINLGRATDPLLTNPFVEVALNFAISEQQQAAGI